MSRVQVCERKYFSATLLDADSAFDRLIERASDERGLSGLGRLDQPGGMSV